MIAGRVGFFSPQGFDPKSVGTLLGWWDATDSATITTVSGAVSQWNDKSSSGYNLTQGTAANRPGTGTLNGKTCLTFNGTTQSMTRTPGASGLSATFFVVCKANSVTSRNNVAFATGIASPGQAQFAAGYNSAASFVGSSRAGSIVGIAGGAANTSTAILGAVVSSTVISSFRRNGVSYTTTGANAIQGNSSGISVGCALTNSSPVSLWDGSIGEILWYSGSLSAGSISSVETYLAAKWGVTL